jgi:uncharacterized protein
MIPRMIGARQVFWEPAGDTGLEHLRLGLQDDRLVADGLIVRQVAQGAPVRLWYRLQCDGSARVHGAQVRLWQEEVERRVDLQADGAGRWADGAGRPLAGLQGCIDLDIAATPFTNTLPIRRLGLRPGGAAEIDVVYIAVPDLRVSRVRQRYSCLRADAGRGVYLYENLQNGFRAELPVDTDGVVLDYPGQWRRREPGGTAAPLSTDGEQGDPCDSR